MQNRRKICIHLCKCSKLLDLQPTVHPAANLKSIILFTHLSLSLPFYVSFIIFSGVVIIFYCIDLIILFYCVVWKNKN